MTKSLKVHALEINAAMIGALFTEQVGDRLRVFCFYLNGDAGQFDVPEEGNRDSLHALFAKLDMVGQCTSVILEKVVRGRIYVERDGVLESYTLLATPGDVLPAFDAEIYNLPWKPVWASQEAEVLKLSGSGNAVHCYAVRNPVNDVDAPSLYRSSCAFVNPMFISEKTVRLREWFRPVAAAAGVVASLGLAVWLGYMMGRGQAPTPVAARELKAEARLQVPPVGDTASPNIQMLANRAITGPFSVEELARLKETGKLPPNALFRIAGDTDWREFQEITKGNGR